jgi:hypothetical protein
VAAHQGWFSMKGSVFHVTTAQPVHLRDRSIMYAYLVKEHARILIRHVLEYVGQDVVVLWIMFYMRMSAYQWLTVLRTVEI